MQIHNDRHAAGERLRSDGRAEAKREPERCRGPERWEDRDENEEE
jgi:hypothetical protein